MVVSYDQKNLEMANVLMIEPGVAINSLGEYIFSSEFIKKCTTVGNSIYCNGKDILVYINGTNTCELIIIHNLLNNDTKPYNPCYDNIVIRPTKKTRLHHKRKLHHYYEQNRRHWSLPLYRGIM